MRTIRQLGAALTALTLSAFAVSPASAANVLVASANGLFGNDCSVGSPCNLAKALSVANPGDFIQLITGGNYFNATVSMEITILSTAGATLSGVASPCLTINAGASDVVTLDGVNCVAASGGNHGIQFNTGEKLRLRNSIIRGVTDAACGVFFQPNTNAELNIESSIISENGTNGGGSGVCVLPRANADVTGVFDRLTAQNNRYGLRTNAGAAAVTNILIQRSVFSGNRFGIHSSGAGSLLRISDTSIYGNVTGLSIASGGSLISLQGNVLRANGTNGAFTGAGEPKE